jgi:PPE-repeat protein
MSRLLVGGLMAFVIGSMAFAQTPTAPAVPKQYQEMATAMAAAQAKAVRPGDEALGCAAIEKELIASMNDPAIQAYAAKSAAAAQLPTGAIGPGVTTPQAAAAMAAALSSNAAIAAAIAGAGATPRVAVSPPTPQQAQAIQQGRAAQSAQLAQLQDPSAQLAMMTTVMPQMMRSQRLVGLALAKGCPSLGAVPAAPPAKR